MRLEEKLLGEGCGLVEPGELLDFVNRERMGLVNTNRDLFEWVCEAIEEIHGLLVKGDVVAGFWEGDKPKREPECQNVLWPILRLKLEAYDLGTVEVEEFFVGPDRCDFWVFCAKPDGVRFQVAVELKVAREGYGRADLVETVEKQLWDQYMKPAGCRYGVFIVLWFRNDRYPGPKAWDKVGDLRKEIVEKCKEVEKLHGVTIVGYVLDMSSEFRRY